MRHLSCPGCAATAQEARSAAAPAPARERIRLVNINGYTVIDREHLVLNGGANRHYLVTLRHRCTGLRTGVHIGTSFPSTTTLTPPFNEYVLVGEPSERCYIDTVETVESVEAAEALVAARVAAEEEGGTGGG